MRENKTKLLQRILSALVIGMVMLMPIMLSAKLTLLLLGIIAAFMFSEWYDIVESRPGFLLVGSLLIAVPFASLALIILIKANWQYILLNYFCWLWATDIIAMVAGKTIDGPKLMPKISPNKTWSGLLVGAVGTAWVALGIEQLAPFLAKFINVGLPFTGKELFFLGLSFAFLEQAGDLTMSYFKRLFNVKDSSDLIPGHGGVLDRFDGIIYTAPFMLYQLSY